MTSENDFFEDASFGGFSTEDNASQQSESESGIDVSDVVSVHTFDLSDQSDAEDNFTSIDSTTVSVKYCVLLESQSFVRELV